MEPRASVPEADWRQRRGTRAKCGELGTWEWSIAATSSGSSGQGVPQEER